MFVLLVVKTSNYELHGEQVTAQVKLGRVPPEQLARLRQAHEEHHATVQAVQAALSGASIQSKIIHRDDEWPPSSSFDLVVTVGGDGTLLLASHHLPENAKIIGVRSSPSSVGHLCAYDGDEATQLAEDLASNQVNWVRIPRMQAKIYSTELGQTVLTPPALNDCLFANRNPAATTRYYLKFGNRGEFHKSSGIWLSTGIGSTAAIRAAGGHQFARETRKLQFLVRELYENNEQTFDLRHELFDPDETPLTIECRSQQAMLAIDGTHGFHMLSFGDTVRIIWAPDITIAVAGKR